MMKLFTILFLQLSLLSSIGQTVITYNSWYKYFKGTTAVSDEWIYPSFNDANWNLGSSPFWYGTGSGGTQLTDMQNKYTTIYLRKNFEVSIDDSLIGKVVMESFYDDGFRIWINGNLAFEKNAPLRTTYNTVAPVTENGFYKDSIDADNVNLIKGRNTIAIQIYNVSLTSSDVYFDLQLSISKKLPKTKDVIFSHNGGYYNSSFTLKLSGENNGDTILYTLDYTDPRYSSSAIKGYSPLNIFINPDNTSNRPATPAVVVRAVIQKKGYISSAPETRTYIFINKVKTQTYPGGNWPNWDVNDQKIDYPMDSRVINDNRYINQWNDIFNTIPTVSLVTDNNNLFDPTFGIYVNALEHGEAWERPASVELIEPGNNQVFSVNAGVRIRGGYSRNDFNPKHAFRLFFRNEYGKKRLNYPIFGENAAQDFKKIDLRCAQNYSWSIGSGSRDMFTYAQDETCRDLQGLTGQPYTRSRYCHLFLNGMYWGVYQFQERPEARFGESYKGGDPSDYDVVKVATDAGYTIEATDGTLDKWREVYNLCNTGFELDQNYFKLQGLNANGNIDTTLENLVDIDNLIDYMINIFYSGNFDSPVSEFLDNKSPNNFYALKNRNAPREGFFFIIHDAEHTFNYRQRSELWSNNGVYENRVSIENEGMTKPAFNKFHPQWLHYRLTANKHYRLRFADRAVKYLYNQGILTPAEVEKVFRNRTQQIDKAIIAESARWGDSNNNSLMTRDDNWLPAVENTVNNFIKLRTNIVINQLKSAGLLPSIAFPVVKQQGNIINKNKVILQGVISVTIENTNGSGVIYYTLDGTDPRDKKGNIAQNAIKINNGDIVHIPYPLILKTRIYNNNEWSALREIIFTNTENRDKIRITEIQYKPVATAEFGSKSLEFIEFKNISDKGVDISGCKIDSAIKITFPEGTIIPPGGFVVVAGDISAFEIFYWKKPTGRFSGNLANEGEKIVLLDEKNKEILSCNYQPISPWPNIIPGYSIVATEKNPTGNPNEPSYWKQSVQIYGSPFSDDDNYVKPLNVHHENIICHVYPNPATDYLYIKVSGKELFKLSLTNLQGKTIYTKTIPYTNYYSETLVFNKIQKGVYLLVIQSKRERLIQKIVIQ